MDKNNKVNCMFLNPAPSLIKYGMHQGMEQIGVNSYLFDYGETALFDKTHEYQLQKIEEMIKIQNTNLLFCEGYGNMPLKEIAEVCKKYSIQLHFWDIESPVTPGIALSVIPSVDFMWSTCIEYVEKFREMGHKSDLLRFACNNKFHIPGVKEAKFEHDISMVGCNYSNRYDKTKEFIYPLFEKFDAMAYGYFWTDYKREVNLRHCSKKVFKGFKNEYLPYEWIGAVIASSKIMIGLNCSDESETQTSCRPYETLGWSNNAVYLAWYTKAQNNIFGDYIYQAKTGQEMSDMAKEILDMTDEQRCAIATKARDYVHANHNYKIRAQKVVDKFFELGGNV